MARQDALELIVALDREVITCSMHLKRKCKIAVDNAALVPDYLKIILFFLVQTLFLYMIKG